MTDKLCSHCGIYGAAMAMNGLCVFCWMDTHLSQEMKDDCVVSVEEPFAQALRKTRHAFWKHVQEVSNKINYDLINGDEQ